MYKMTQKKQSYHHGHLVEAISKAALKRMANDGIKSLKLRQLAGDCGVTATAIYRHFDNKEHLLAHLATYGYRKFSKALTTAGNESDPIPERILSRGIAYVEFAIADPCLFELMFGPYIEDVTPYVELQEAMQEAMDILIEDTQASIEAGMHSKEEDPEYVAYNGWALVHGLATLCIQQEIMISGRPLKREQIRRILLVEGHQV